MQIVKSSHLDHGLSPAHVAWLLARFAGRDAFFIETVELPADLDPVDCCLYGPTVGDAPVSEETVTYAIRGARKCASRLVDLPTRKTRTLSIIAGPDKEGNPCVLYTSYGGPSAPREPGDTSIPEWGGPEGIAASRAFWAEHALTK